VVRCTLVPRLMRVHGLLAPQCTPSARRFGKCRDNHDRVGPTSYGARTRPGSTRTATGGAGSWPRSIRRATTSAGGTPPRSPTDGRRWNRPITACARSSGSSAKTSRGARRCGAIGVRSMSPMLTGTSWRGWRHPQPLVRRRAPVQWRHGAVHSHAQGAVPVAAPVRHARGGAARDRVFIERYNHAWLIERLGPRTPAAARKDLLAAAA